MASNDFVYGNQLTLGSQHSKIIIACTVGGACLVFTAGLVFCLLVCRRWIHDKHRTRRQGHRRNRTPPAVSAGHGTLASSSGYHTTTSSGRRMSSSVTMLPNDMSIPLPPDTSWRSSSVPSDVPRWWYQHPGNLSSSDAVHYDLSPQFSADIASRVNTSYFTSPAAAAVTSTQHCDVTTQHGQQQASSLDLYSSTSSGSAEQRNLVLANGPDVDRQASDRSSSSETRLWRPSVARSTFDDHAATSAGEWSGSGVRQSVSKNVRSSARCSGQRSADRKHSDCGLQRHQVNTSVVSPDRNTWELVTRTAPVVRDSKSPVTNGLRTSGFRVRANVDISDGDENNGNNGLCDNNVWIRRFPPIDRHHIRPEQRHGRAQTARRSGEMQNGHGGHVPHRDMYSIEPSCNAVLSNLSEYRYGRSTRS